MSQVTGTLAKMGLSSCSPAASASITIPPGANLALPGGAVQVGPVENTQRRLNCVPVGAMGRYQKMREVHAVSNEPARRDKEHRKTETAVRLLHRGLRIILCMMTTLLMWNATAR